MLRLFPRCHGGTVSFFSIVVSARAWAHVFMGETDGMPARLQTAPSLNRPLKESGGWRQEQQEAKVEEAE